jgi:hypothetical protein
MSLEEYLKSHNLTTHSGLLMNRSLADKYLQDSEVNAIIVRTVVKAGEHRKMVNGVSVDQHGLDPGTRLELRIYRPDGFKNLTSKVARVMTKHARARDLVSVSGLSEGDITVETTSPSGKRRNLRVSRPDETWLSYDITYEVGFQGGNPIFAKVDEYASNLLKEIRTSLL